MSRWTRIASWFGVALALLLFSLPLFHPHESLAATSLTVTPAFQKQDGVVTTSATDDSAAVTAVATYELLVANESATFSRPYLFSKTGGVALATHQEQFKVVERSRRVSGSSTQAPWEKYRKPWTSPSRSPGER